MAMAASAVWETTYGSSAPVDRSRVELERKAAERVMPFRLPSPEQVAEHRARQARSGELAAVAGTLNTMHAHLVKLAVRCMADGDHVGPGLVTLAQFVAWKTGVSMATARCVERVAKRVEELPILWAALQAGEISLEQANEVARYAPVGLDRSATMLARSATVTQLHKVLRHYADPKGKPEHLKRGVGLSRNEDGGSSIFGDLDADQAALVAKALEAMRDDLYRQRRADAAEAARAAGETDVDEETIEVDAPTGAEALAAMAETVLQAGEVAHPTSTRYLIGYHLSAGLDGRPILVDDHGHAVIGGERARLLCDHRFESILHDHHDGTPLSVGRITRLVSDKLRRVLLHRHGHACAVPGCGARLGLEIHHIIHWEDQGPTDTWNLLPLCKRHHKAHHHGLLHIEGNADLPMNTPGGLIIGPPERPMAPVGEPDPPRLDLERHRDTPEDRAERAERLDRLRDEVEHLTGTRPPEKASTPTGERLDLRYLHLNAEAPPEAEPPLRTGPGDEPPGDQPPKDDDPTPPSPPPPRPRADDPPSGTASPQGPPHAHGPPTP